MGSRPAQVVAAMPKQKISRAGAVVLGGLRRWESRTRVLESELTVPAPKEDVMSKEWPLGQARKRPGEVIDRALCEGSQQIARRGKMTAVILSIEDYAPPKCGNENLVHFLRRAPLSARKAS
jgi:prevent-host-death family protein